MRSHVCDLDPGDCLDRRVHFTAVIVATMGAPEGMNATPLSSEELSVVMPVYNEADAVEPVVRAWAEELDRLKIGYEFLVYDDGSRDRTAAVLRQIAIETASVALGARASAHRAVPGRHGDD